MTFSEALEALKKGQGVARAAWAGTGFCIRLQVPDAHSKMTLPYIYASGADRMPWAPQSTDLLAEDWENSDG